MANSLDDSAFDLHGILDSAGSAPRRRHKSSRRFRSTRRQLISDGDGTVFDIPPPTLLQRRRSRFVADTRNDLPLTRLFEDGDASDQEHTEHTYEELCEKLYKFNKTVNGKGTIRLPSDALHRRKSRFDTEEMGVAGDDDFGIVPLNFNNMAIEISRRRAEEDPVQTTYKRVAEFYKDITFLRNTLKRIQGRFGAAIMEYFSFVKWLVLLNVFITFVTLPIILPKFFLDPADFNATLIKIDNDSYRFVGYAENCSREYERSLNQSTRNCENVESIPRCLVDFIQGNGLFENTFLFYGSYRNLAVKLPDGTSTIYPMFILFITAVLVVLIVSLLLILYNLSGHRRSAVVNAGGATIDKFCNAVLSSWDYGLTDQRAVKLKKSLFRQKLRQLITDQQIRSEFTARTTIQKVGLWVVRGIVNLLVLGVLGVCAYGAYITQEVSNNQTQSNSMTEQQNATTNTAEQLFFEYLPTGFITLTYLVVPFFFYAIVKLERYKPSTEINITMVRIIFVRLLSLMTLLLTTLGILMGREKIDTDNPCGKSNAKNTATTSLEWCWETYLGQQIYKLVLLDFAVLLIITYVIEYPRQALYKKFENTSFMKWLGQQEFDMPKNVMDVLYNQTLCWIGVFFSPIIPLLIAVKMFLFFWIKKASLFANQKPSPTLAKSSAVYSFFLWIMLFSLFSAYFVLIIYMQSIEPSRSCGPFRVHRTGDFTMTDTLTVFIDLALSPEAAGDALKFLTSSSFRIALYLVLIVVLSLLWYYFVMISNGLEVEAKLYVQQLARSVKDKQFLLEKVQNSIKETNTQMLRAKSSTNLRDADTSPTTTDNEHNSDSNYLNILPSGSPVNGSQRDVNGNIPTSNADRKNERSREHIIAATDKHQHEMEIIDDNVQRHMQFDGSSSEDEASEDSRDYDNIQKVSTLIYYAPDTPRKRQQNKDRRNRDTNDKGGMRTAGKKWEEIASELQTESASIKLLRSGQDDKLERMHKRKHNHTKSEPTHHGHHRQQFRGGLRLNDSERNIEYNDAYYKENQPTDQQKRDYQNGGFLNSIRNQGYDNETFTSDEEYEEHKELPQPRGFVRQDISMELEHGRLAQYDSAKRVHEDESSKGERKQRSRQQKGYRDIPSTNFRIRGYDNESLIDDERWDGHRRVSQSIEFADTGYAYMGQTSKQLIRSNQEPMFDERRNSESHDEYENFHRPAKSPQYQSDEKLSKTKDSIMFVREGRQTKNPGKQYPLTKSTTEHHKYSDEPTPSSDGRKIPKRLDDRSREIDYYENEQPQARRYDRKAKSNSYENHQVDKLGQSKFHQRQTERDLGVANESYIAEIGEDARYSGTSRSESYYKNKAYDSDPEPDYN